MSCKATNSLLLDMQVYMLDLSLNILQSGLYAIKMLSFPVAQLVEHGASNANIMGSIPRESKSWQNVETVTWMQSKSLWIKASAKCINVNVKCMLWFGYTSDVNKIMFYFKCVTHYWLQIWND